MLPRVRRFRGQRKAVDIVVTLQIPGAHRTGPKSTPVPVCSELASNGHRRLLFAIIAAYLRAFAFPVGAGRFPALAPRPLPALPPRTKPTSPPLSAADARPRRCKHRNDSGQPDAYDHRPKRSPRLSMTPISSWRHSPAATRPALSRNAARSRPIGSSQAPGLG